ncbi:protein NO VEIN domain-containing protein [Mycolicibacterium monacense]|uniref:protein NO VEIN domain-containing protein n=1 Tax=Mycolicibacterium monacense TaxID=85693 RepID=UPI00104243A6|nr:DUF3883 domain-containing protein [Mycolicibacterium monacense]
MTTDRDGRRAMILTWNPDKFAWDEDEYADHVTRTAQGDVVTANWSTGNRVGGVSVGDRVFLLRQGSRGRGIVGSGTVIGEIYQDDDWDHSGDAANYVDFVFDRLLRVADLLPTEVLKQELPETNWDRIQMSGTFIRGPQVGALEEMWSDHIGASAIGGAARAQAIMADRERRKKIEDAAQERLMGHYRGEGWRVRDTRYGNPFDAIAERDGKLLYLEAKGTQSQGHTVHLTRNEVDHALANDGLCVIGIWSGIQFNSSDQVDSRSGRFDIIPFRPQDIELIPIAYEWALPIDGTSLGSSPDEWP